MAPSILARPSEAPHTLISKRDNNNNAPRDVFPDGIRTSGQLDPEYSLLQPYESFPEHIEGPTAWKREDYADQPKKWVHRFTDEEIEELGKARYADEVLEVDPPPIVVPLLFLHACCIGRCWT